jgi:hypothetical protein
MLGHFSVGARGRRFTNVCVVLAGILAYVAGFGGLIDLVGKTVASALALCAGASITAAVLAFTILKPQSHLESASEYERVYLQLLECATVEEFHSVRQAFYDLVNDTNRAGTPLTPGQVRRFKRLARRQQAREEKALARYRSQR